MSSRLDFWLPRFDFREFHSIEADAAAGRVFHAVRRLDMAASPWVRLLFRIRGLPTYALRFDGLERFGFIPLEERPGRELILGLAGRFWTIRGGIQRLDRDGFSEFQVPGNAKVVWNFAVEGPESGPVKVTTETRIWCTDHASRRRFRFYWMVVRPFSGLIRRQMLEQIRSDALLAETQPNSGETG